MKRKIVGMMLVLALTAVNLCGCGGTAGEGAQTNPATTEEAGNPAQEPTEAPTPEGEDAPAQEKDEAPVLKEAVMGSLGCRIGAAATESELKDPKVWEIITTHFNALTFGNELKPDALFGYSNARCPGTEEAELNGETIIVPKMDYSRAERMLNKVYDWNQEHPDDRIMLRGHVLVWHSQTPEWFFHVDYDKNKDYVDKDTMNKRLEWYIRTVLTHFTGEDSKYKGMFYGWDVVNEAVSDNPSRVYRCDEENPNEPLSNDTHGSNSSWWRVYQSEEFIINAFIYANKYAPAELELYYNDYNECVFKKSQGIKELLHAVKDREGEPGTGTRISGMGMQGHYNMTDPEMFTILNILEEYAEIVGNVQFTEVDIKASSDYDGSAEAKETEYEKQAKRYRNLYWVMKKARENGANVTGITFWGTVDHYSWLQSRSDVGGGASGNLPQCPLLFDENYEPKPAFYVFAETEE